MAEQVETIAGWDEIAKSIGVSVVTAKRYAVRQLDPLPVHVLLGRHAFAYTTAIRDWNERNGSTVEPAREVARPSPADKRGQGWTSRSKRFNVHIDPTRFPTPPVPPAPIERDHEVPIEKPIGKLVYGWVAIAETLKMGLNEVKRYASRRKDPLPVYCGNGRISASKADLIAWCARQSYTETMDVNVFRHAHAVFVGGKKLAGPGVYAVVAEGAGRIKIGWTDALHRRLNDLETACPFPLQVLFWIRGPRDLESELHRKCARDRVHLEWFTHTPEVHEALLDAIQDHGGAWVPQR